MSVRVHEDFMKKKFFTLLLSAAAVAFICNCGDDAILNVNNTTPIVGQPAFLYKDGSTNYIVYVSGFVTNENGDTIGTADLQGGTIYALDQSIIADGLDFTKLDILEPTIITAPAWILSAGQNYVIYTDGTVTDAVGNPIGLFIYNTDESGTVSTTVGNIVTFEGLTIFENVDLTTLKIYASNQPNTLPPVPVSSSSDNGNTDPYIDPNPDPTSSAINPGESSSSNNKATSSSSKTTKSSSSTAKSSSSAAKSSSSTAKSSSSAKQTGGCPNIKTKGGGGNGWATRYWDCCKPSCSWQENAGGNPAKQCTHKGKNPSTDWGGGSICSGGGLMTCTSQIPFTVDGCTEMGFAFAAVPASNGGQCGKCFQLTFTGKGKYSTDANHTAIKGKKLIIMVTNVGHDVEQGQFDIMIPGGGVGAFDGCSNAMGWGNQGERYGGLLSDCEKSSNYKPTATLSCLKEKCNSSFGSDSEAKQGCLFLAEFMHAAGNPLHEYVEVECPDVLKQKY